MVIHNLDLVGVTILPYEAHSPLIFDPDAVLACRVSFPRLQLLHASPARESERSAPASGHIDIMCIDLPQGRRVELSALAIRLSGENFELKVDIFRLELEQVGIGFFGDCAA